MALLLPLIVCLVQDCPSCPRPAKFPDAAPADGFEKLGPPKPGEWRDRFKEEPQSFEQYVRGCANRKCAHRKIFYIQPVGDALAKYRETIERMRAYAEIFFNTPAQIADPIPLLDAAHVETRRQYDSTKIIEHLAGRVPKDALVYVGITEKDLFSKGFNFVFGEGSLANRCGIYSLVRYESKDPKVFLRRALKLMSHEVGHILSIDHCVTYACVMQGANHLLEDDGHPMHLCPIDLRKVEWNTGFDREDRYRKLLEFYRKGGLADEEEWVSKRLTPR